MLLPNPPKDSRLTPVKPIEIIHKGNRKYCFCDCLCGTRKLIRIDSLNNGESKSCGCLHREAVTKHGMKKTKIYHVWAIMLDRCNNPHSIKYPNYGGRGIKVCDRWLKFENFFTDMGDKPSEEYSLDRINNDGDYTKDNCRWATNKEQSRNKRNNIKCEINGEIKLLIEWCEIYKANYYTVYEVINYKNWKVIDALNYYGKN